MVRNGGKESGVNSGKSRKMRNGGKTSGRYEFMGYSLTGPKGQKICAHKPYVILFI